MPTEPQPKMFKYRHFEASLILLCVRWYLRYSLSYRDLEEMMIERGLCVDHTTVYQRLQVGSTLRPPSGEAVPC